MTATINLALANAETHQLFTRKLENNTNYYDALMQKIASLLKRAHEQQVYALLSLHRIQESIQGLINQLDDELDTFEGVLEKKKQTRGKVVTFETRFHVKVHFEHGIAVDLVTLFELYDRLISTLKLLRATGSFANDDDYYNNLRRYFKSMNQLLSQILLASVKTLPHVTFSDAIDKTASYIDVASTRGEIDCEWLYRAMTSNLAPRLHESKRKPLLLRLKNRLEPRIESTELPLTGTQS